MNLLESGKIQDFLVHAQQAVQNSVFHLNVFNKEWTFLVNSESKLISLMAGNEQPPGNPGDAEYGLILYWLNQPNPFTNLLITLGMPASQISTALYDSWGPLIETGPGVIMRDGTLVSTVKYATFDLVWAEAFLFYLRSRYAKDLPPGIAIPIHDFGTTPQQLSLDGAPSVKIVIMGDWGTGSWPDGNNYLCPAELVSEAIKGLSPDLVIHLGDVYYYGSASQEKSNLLALWNGGATGSFTLNSNHEMYDGANGYFDTALANNIFVKQQNTSYFAITYGNWIIFGLDSAYYDQSTLYSDGAVNDAAQLAFINNVLTAAGPGKKIIVLTHHQAVSYDASQLNTYQDGSGSLANDIYTALGNRLPDYWYYGHLHNGIVYDSTAIQNSGIFNPIAAGLTSSLRCMGHGAIPFGKAFGLDGSALVNYFSQTPVPNPTPRQTNRVLNGFTVITLDPTGLITEEVYEVANDTANGVTTTLVWHN